MAAAAPAIELPRPHDTAAAKVLRFTEDQVIGNLDVVLTPKIGANVQQQLEGDLKDEEDAVRQYNSAMNVCAEGLDNGSGDLFQRMLKDEEGHADFLDAQLHSIKEMGIGTYLAQQLHGEK